MENGNSTVKNIGQSRCICCKHRLMDSNSHDKIRVYVFNRTDTMTANKMSESFALCGKCADLLNGNDNYSPQTICTRLKNVFKYVSTSDYCTSAKENKLFGKDVGTVVKKHIDQIGKEMKFYINHM